MNWEQNLLGGSLCSRSTAVMYILLNLCKKSEELGTQAPSCVLWFGIASKLRAGGERPELSSGETSSLFSTMTLLHFQGGPYSLAV